jgi:hypothetical protein
MFVPDTGIEIRDFAGADFPAPKRLACQMHQANEKRMPSDAVSL